MLNGSGLAVDRLFAAFLENHFSIEKQNLVMPSSLKVFYQKHLQSLVGLEDFFST
jgi:seryl-tRNA synthetase